MIPFYGSSMVMLSCRDIFTVHCMKYLHRQNSFFSGDRTPPINYYRAAMRYQTPPLATRQVLCPTMMIWGTGDTYLEKGSVEASRKYVQGDPVIRYLEGTSHWVQQEEPEKVNEYIKEFLRGEAMP